MSQTVARHFIVLAPITLLVACNPDVRDLPSAPGITAHLSGEEHSAVPSPRGTLQMVHDPVKDRLYLVGGISPIPCEDLACGNSLIDDLWSFNPRSRTWQEISDQLPPREGDAAAFDTRSRRIIMYQPFFNNEVATWVYDPDRGTWENRHPAVEPPARFGSMMVYDARADRALLFGGAGLSDNTGLNDLWAYDYESNTWTERHPAMSPPPRNWHALVYVPTSDRTVMFGGTTPADVLLNDTWAYDYHRNRWTSLNPRHPPAPRLTHYMAFEPRTNRLVLFGGFLAPYDQAANDTWIYDVEANRWSQVFPKESPGPRAWHVMSRTNGSVVLFGGGPDQAGWTNETFIYDSRANTWRKVSGENEAATAMISNMPSSVATGGVTAGRLVPRSGPPTHRH